MDIDDQIKEVKIQHAFGISLGERTLCRICATPTPRYTAPLADTMHGETFVDNPLCALCFKKKLNVQNQSH